MPFELGQHVVNHLADKQLYDREGSFKESENAQVLGKASLKRDRKRKGEYAFLKNSEKGADLGSCVATV